VTLSTSGRSPVVCGLAHIEDNAMPANNRLLVFRKEN